MIIFLVGYARRITNDSNDTQVRILMGLAL